MALKDLGEKQLKDIYDGPTTVKRGEPKVTYQEISLPLKLVEKMGLNVDDTVTLTLKGRLSGLEDTRWSKRVSFEIKKGEVVRDGKSKKSILDEA